jgi:hypothetical protein
LVLTDAIKGSKSCDKVIPFECIELMTTLFSYFSKSAKKKKELRDFIAHQNSLRKLDRPLQNPDDLLTHIVAELEEQHKLQRRIVLTRWLSCADAVKVIVNSGNLYATFVVVAECEKRNPTDVCRQISDWLQDNTIMAWYHCLLDVLPVLTNVNVLFQSKLPIPHMLYVTRYQTQRVP